MDGRLEVGTCCNAPFKSGRSTMQKEKPAMGNYCVISRSAAQICASEEMFCVIYHFGVEGLTVKRSVRGLSVISDAPPRCTRGAALDGIKRSKL